MHTFHHSNQTWQGRVGWAFAVSELGSAVRLESMTVAESPGWSPTVARKGVDLQMLPGAG